LGFFTQFNGQVRDPIYGYIDYTKELEGVVMDSWVCCFPRVVWAAACVSVLGLLFIYVC